MNTHEKMYELLLDIALRISTSPPDRIGQNIQDALGRIAGFSSADLGCILPLTDDGIITEPVFISKSCESSSDLQDTIVGLDFKKTGSLYRKLSAFEPVCIVSGQGDQAAEACAEDILWLSRFKSAILSPMVCGKSLGGVMILVSEKEKPMFPEWIMPAVQVIGQIIAATLERKRLIDENRKLEVHLRTTDKIRTIGSMSAAIAHDFNNLLMVIQGNISLFQHQLNVGPSHSCYEGLTSISRQIQSGSRLTKRLLSYAREKSLEIGPLNLNRLVRETSVMFEKTRKGITVYRELADELPYIEADESQIEQILLNLYVNAAEAMSGKGSLYLSTGNATKNNIRLNGIEAAPGRYVMLTVRDTGKGMDKEMQQRIFDPFFSDKPHSRGSGLGLTSICSILKEHNGYICVDSVKGQGAVFSLFWPAMEKTARVPDRKTAVNMIVPGRGTILLVDDEDRVLNIGTRILKFLNYSVMEAKNGREAIDIYESNKGNIDLVILDVIMPEMDGEETFERLKAIDPDVKVLLASGYDIGGRAKSILAKGCSGFIQKPYGMDELSRKLAEVLTGPLRK